MGFGTSLETITDGYLDPPDERDDSSDEELLKDSHASAVDKFSGDFDELLCLMDRLQEKYRKFVIEDMAEKTCANWDTEPECESKPLKQIIDILES